MYFKKFSGNFFALIILLVQISVFTSIEAKNRDIKLPDSWHQSEAWAEVNLLGELSSNVSSRLQGTVKNILVSDKDFYLYLGFGFKAKTHILEPTFGYSFKQNEWIGALRAYFNWKNWQGYSNLEYQEKSQSFYYISQFETKINSFFKVGVEAEGQGYIYDFQKSNGLGIYFVLNFETFRRYNNNDTQLRFEFALQNKKINGERRPQLIVRFKFSTNTD